MNESPEPSATDAEADGLLRLLEAAIPLTEALIDPQPPKTEEAKLGRERRQVLLVAPTGSEGNPIQIKLSL
jgi:hypothetical protein